jgi:hypothetical protein
MRDTGVNRQFRIETRREFAKLSNGWVCRVYDFFGQLIFIGKGKFRDEAGSSAKSFELDYAAKEKEARDRFSRADLAKRGKSDTWGKTGSWHHHGSLSYRKLAPAGIALTALN